MKIKIEIDECLTETEVIIRSCGLDEQVQTIQKMLSEVAGAGHKFIFYKEDTEYYLPLQDVLFYETEGNVVYAHTRTDVFMTKYKLYELEELLPGFFMRISKSAILNLHCVYSITRSLSAACLVRLHNTHKQVYVSRNYYKLLWERLEEKRI